MRRNVLRVTKTVLLIWIACVSTFLGIIVPTFMTRSQVESTEIFYINQGDVVVPVLFHTQNATLQTILETKYKEYETQYYVPRKERVNPMDYEFLIGGRSSVCKSTTPYLLIVVPSIPEHFARRDAVRKTYGSFAENSIYDNGFRNILNDTVKLVFVLGKTRNDITTEMLKGEQTTFGDLIQADFTDSYYNLTIKMTLALKWVSENCYGLKYLLKIDEDIFVNVPHLVRFLRDQKYDPQGTIFGKIHTDHPVQREGKWKVDFLEFPLTNYPTYAAGNSYVISGNILQRLYENSEYMPYLSIEDAFITGCLARIVGATHVNVHGFTWWDQVAPGPCGFYEEQRYTGNQISLALMYKLWTGYVSYDKVCRENRMQFLSSNMKIVFSEQDTKATSK